jgi:hypothetical protein
VFYRHGYEYTLFSAAQNLHNLLSSRIRSDGFQITSSTHPASLPRSADLDGFAQGQSSMDVLSHEAGLRSMECRIQ